MRKVLLLMAMAVVSLAINAQQLKPGFARQQAPVVQKAVAEANSMEFGYCGEFSLSLGFGMKGTMRAVIEIPATDAAKWAGAQITTVKVGVGTYGINPDAKIVILSDIDGSEPVYTQSFTPVENEWNEIVLDTPYTIGENGFFVGYQIGASAQSYPFGIDDTPGKPLGDLVGYYDDAKGKYMYLHLGEQGYGNNCIKLVLEGDNLPQYDLVLEDVSVKQYIKTGEEFSITGQVKNVATQTINTFDLTYQIGDAEAQTQTITAYGGLKNSETYTFSVDNLVLNEDGDYDVVVTISNPNGMADESEVDNTITKTVTALSTLVPRKVLLENFSTAQCGNCPRVHEMLNRILADRDDVAWVVHHSGFGTDTYTIDASTKYLWFYGSGDTFAPAAMLDRRCLKDLGAEGASGPATSPIFFPASESSVEDYISYCLDQPAFISLNVEDVYNEETRELTVRVYGECAIELAKASRMNIFLTENGLVGYQSGGGNSYRHNHAIRKVMTATWGDELTFDNGSYDVTYTCVLDEGWKPENMSVVAFVSDYNSTNYNESTVHNTEWKILEYGAAVGKITNDQCRVWTANKMISLNGNYDNAAVYTIDGRLVKEANGKSYISMDNAGIYIVVVDGVSHKVIIK